MNKVILGSVFGTRLNLNGDQGNLLALRRYLEAAGLTVEVRPVISTDDALGCNFVMLGHGSMAAMKSLEPQLTAFDWSKILERVPGLAVGSGFEWLAREVLSTAVTESENRVSEFQVAELGIIRALGYRNTATDLPNLQLNGSFICSMLHGPLLAKNPRLLHRAAQTAAKSASLELKHTPELAAWVNELNRICGGIWKLEAPEAEYQELSLK
ncbi:MAG: hypothetical protein ACKOWK_03775 [Micrococcales bacterium]